MICSVVDLGRSEDGVGSGSEVEGDGGGLVVDGDGEEVFPAAGQVAVPYEESLRRLGVEHKLDVDLWSIS